MFALSSVCPSVCPSFGLFVLPFVFPFIGLSCRPPGLETGGNTLTSFSGKMVVGCKETIMGRFEEGREESSEADTGSSTRKRIKL